RVNCGGWFLAWLFAGSRDDLGRIAYSDSLARIAVHQLFRGDLGLASLRVRDAACHSRRIHSELCPCTPRRGVAAGGHNPRIQMNPETCLSCDRIERFLGEDEERVHALRGVSLAIEAGGIHA